jgi:3-oxoacyl-[acyl-carrier protein] reductase
MDLTGRTALVTGGSGDLGGAIARALAAAGVDVAVSYASRPDGATATAGAVRAAGRRSLTVALDQRDPVAIEAAVARVAGEWGRLDILVNNAAWNVGIPFADLDTLTAGVWDRVLETNLRGPYLLARACAPHLRARGAGRIVNIASVGGLYPGSSSIAYSASKAGLIHLSRCLAVALAPAVTVNCIAPGLIEGTRMALRLPEEVSRWAREQAVLGRTASDEDIAGQVVTFCRAESVTGQVLVVDGGMPALMH